MKNLSEVILFLLILLPVFIFGQDSKWVFSFNSNVVKIEIEKDIVDLNFAKSVEFGYDIHRKSVHLVGGDFGMKRRFKIMDNFYFLTGFDFRISRLEIQEWLKISYGESRYSPSWEMQTITLDGKVDREKLNMFGHKNAINPFPEDKPNTFKDYFTFLDIPLNIHFEPNSKKWFTAAGFILGVSMESLAYAPRSFSHKNIFLGVNTNFSIKFYDNWFLSIGYVGFHEGVYPSKEVFFNSGNQHIFSLGLSCLIKP